MYMESETWEVSIEGEVRRSVPVLAKQLENGEISLCTSQRSGRLK